MEIRVLHVLNSYGGGAVLSTLELIKALEEREVQCSIVADEGADKEEREIIASYVNGRVIFIPLYWKNKRIRAKVWKRPFLEVYNLWRTWGGNKYQTKIRELIKRNDINLIHSSAIVNPEGAIAARRNELPHIWHVREIVGAGRHYQFHNYSRWKHFVEIHSNLLIANSEVTQSCLLEFFSRDKVRCIPNGINFSLFTPKIHHEDGTIVVAMVGSVTSRLKNHQFFLRTVASLMEYQNLEFRIYGSLPPDSDPYFMGIKELCEELGLSTRVKFMGFVKSPSLIMNEIDVLFHPTANESFGRIFVEAMASSIPVIAVAEGGALEILRDGENGFLIDDNDVPYARECILALVQDKNKREVMGKNGRERVKEKYTIDILAEKIIGIYREVLNQ